MGYNGESVAFCAPPNLAAYTINFSFGNVKTELRINTFCGVVRIPCSSSATAKKCAPTLWVHKRYTKSSGGMFAIGIELCMGNILANFTPLPSRRKGRKRLATQAAEPRRTLFCNFSNLTMRTQKNILQMFAFAAWFASRVPPPPRQKKCAPTAWVRKRYTKSSGGMFAIRIELCMGNILAHFTPLSSRGKGRKRLATQAAEPCGNMLLGHIFKHLCLRICPCTKCLYAARVRPLSPPPPQQKKCAPTKWVRKC